MLVCLLLVATSRAQSLDIAPHVGLPGGGVRVPVLVSNVPSLAAAALTLNYDPQVLTLTNVRSASLGAFTVDYQDVGGSVRLAAVQTDALANASGAFAVLEFVVKPGAPEGAVSPLTIADRSLSGAAGNQLEWSSLITHTDGSFTVVSAAMDADADGLPDWWEDWYLGSVDFTTGAEDSDNDGITNQAEYLAGSDPLIGEPPFRIQYVSRTAQGLGLNFSTLSGRAYHVEESPDLINWTPRPDGISGDGNPAQVTVPFAADGSPRFYRLRSP